MCAQYLIKANLKSLNSIFGIDTATELTWPERIVPYSVAPVCTTKGLQLMQYSLIPNWAKDKKVKFATYNARIESIDTKPTWRVPFRKNHCLVPISGFIEPIYEGEFAGHMAEFYAENLLVAAGIYDEWLDKETGEILESFALVMTEPTDFIRNTGHDRQPIFLRPADAQKWINNEIQATKEMKEFLLNSNFTPPLEVRSDRAMRPGWEKRKN